ncbi:hypothetical protein KC799_25665, partial [candidate division KSB1 bacterium]|nr:hypothetical protein [candidate division KSB1 bacterium]
VRRTLYQSYRKNIACLPSFKGKCVAPSMEEIRRTLSLVPGFVLCRVLLWFFLFDRTGLAHSRGHAHFRQEPSLQDEP